jgi:uncharacterized coiled-coil protein SlyX
MSARPLPADNSASDEEEDHEGSADILSDEEQSAEKDITKSKKAQSTLKHVWLLTYGARDPFITPEMLHTFLKKKNEDDGCPNPYEVKECHSTKDRTMSVTYLFLTDKVRRVAIENFMTDAGSKHGIALNSVSGHESIASISKMKNATPIQEHIGFKMLRKHYINKNPAFKPWTDGEPVLKRGYIFEAAEDKPEKKPHRVRKNSVSKDNEQLRAENTKLLTKYAALETKYAAQKRKIQELEGTDAAQKRELQEFKRAQHDLYPRSAGAHFKDLHPHHVDGYAAESAGLQ